MREILVLEVLCGGESNQSSCRHMKLCSSRNLRYPARDFTCRKNGLANVLLGRYHILKPTRITNHSSTLIDNIFFNSIEYQTVSENLLYDLTDHLPHFLIIERFAFSKHKEKIFRRDYSNYNEEAFLNEFTSIDWSNLFHGLSDTTV